MLFRLVLLKGGEIMSLSIIAAVDKNKLLGNKGEIPWELPADLKYFKETTMGAPVIMGRKTFESIGFALPGRKNIIMTRNKNYNAEGCQIVHSKSKILNIFLENNKESFIIGGAEIYKIFLPYSDKLYLTVIDHKFLGDTYFPEVNWKNWNKISEKMPEANNSPYSYSYKIYSRKK